MPIWWYFALFAYYFSLSLDMHLYVSVSGQLHILYCLIFEHLHYPKIKLYSQVATIQCSSGHWLKQYVQLFFAPFLGQDPAQGQVLPCCAYV